VQFFYRAAQYGNLSTIGCAKAALPNIDNPKIKLSRLPYPIFSPTKLWEIEGTVNNVVYPQVMPSLETTYKSTVAWTLVVMTLQN
jgi:predicted GH43/DUF377 family glycosyl hydrolase